MSGHNQFALLRQRRFAVLRGPGTRRVQRQRVPAGDHQHVAVHGRAEDELGLYATLAPAIFILPYFLFSALAGQIADKLEKSRLIVITTTMEIVIMSLAPPLPHPEPAGAAGGPVLHRHAVDPVRPGEVLGAAVGAQARGTDRRQRPGRDGHLDVDPVRHDRRRRCSPWPAATAPWWRCAIIALAICGNIAARLIPKVDAGDPNLKINWNPLPESLAVLRMARQQKAVRNSILGVLVLVRRHRADLAATGLCVVTNLGGEPTLYIFALALFSVGTGIGSLLCEKLSAHGGNRPGAAGRVRHDRVPARPVLRPQRRGDRAGLAIGPFLQQPGSSRIVIDLVGIGLFTGIFVVPLFALIQSRTPKAQMSRVFAALNIQNSGFIVAAALLSLAAHTLLHWTIPQQFLALAIANALVAIYIFTIVPEFLMRFLSWLMVRTLYRLRPHGIEANVPDEGAALLVCNHVSYMDALILSATIPRPPSRVLPDLQHPGAGSSAPPRRSRSPARAKTRR